jgi:transposase
MDFETEFPDDATCLDWLVGFLYPDGIYCPKCERITSHYRVKARPAYSCQFCGHYEYPMAGTIFEGSSTSLRLWFHAMYLMASTRCGISAKQLEREIGVSYPTAWRMFKQIRSMLSPDDDKPLSGTVEMDETYIGGTRKGQPGRPGRGDPKKSAVFGMAERGTNGGPGRIVAKHVPDARAASLMPHVQQRVLPATMVYTDELHSYKRLPGMGYGHERVRHSEKIYVSGDVHVNTVEGFWALLKGGLSGVYHGVSTKHLQEYLDEFCFRYNSREITGRRGMFDAFLSRIEKV